MGLQAYRPRETAKSWLVLVPPEDGLQQVGDTPRQTALLSATQKERPFDGELMTSSSPFFRSGHATVSGLRTNYGSCRVLKAYAGGWTFRRRQRYI